MGPSVAVGKVGWRRGDFQRWKRLVHVCVIESREEVIRYRMKETTAG